MGCQSIYLQDKETSCKHNVLSLSGGEHQAELWEPMDMLDKIQAVFEVIWHKLLQELKHSWIIVSPKGILFVEPSPSSWSSNWEHI